MKKNPTRVFLPVFLLLAVLLLASCAPVTPTQPAVDTVATIVAGTMTANTPVPSPVPSETTPAVVAKVVLVGQPAATQALQAGLSKLAQKDGLALETREQISAGDLDPSWKVVVLAAPPANLAEIVQAAPGTQFLAIGQTEARAGNLSLITTNRENELFLAGYLAAVATSDWRFGALLPSDAAQGSALSDAFVNGGKYYCGRCVPLEAPVVFFPLVAALPAGSSPEQWKAGLDELQKKVLQVVYLAPEASQPEVMAYLAGLDLRMVGSQTPPREYNDRWVATVSSDPLESLRTLWPDLVAGKGGKILSARITVSDINEQLLSSGRQRLVNDVIDRLGKGLINPLSVP